MPTKEQSNGGQKPKKQSKRAKANAGAEPYNVAATGDDLEKVTT
jgi:hypothetical protein